MKHDELTTTLSQPYPLPVILLDEAIEAVGGVVETPWIELPDSAGELWITIIED